MLGRSILYINHYPLKKRNSNERSNRSEDRLLRPLDGIHATKIEWRCFFLLQARLSAYQNSRWTDDKSTTAVGIENPDQRITAGCFASHGERQRLPICSTVLQPSVIQLLLCRSVASVISSSPLAGLVLTGTPPHVPPQHSALPLSTPQSSPIAFAASQQNRSSKPQNKTLSTTTQEPHKGSELTPHP